MKNIVFHQEADEEMMASAEYYDSKSDGLGIKFLNEVLSHKLYSETVD